VNVLLAKWKKIKVAGFDIAWMRTVPIEREVELALFEKKVYALTD
jgi:hypothetical protein